MFTADTLSPLSERIHVEGMISPGDIVACHNDRQLYVADQVGDCIWRVSVDDKSYVKWLTTTGDIMTLSLTSHRLLVTSRPRSLRQYSTTDSRQLRHILLPEYMKEVYHSVESSRQTFIVGTSRNEVGELFTFCCVSSSRKFMMMMIIIINNTTSTTSNNNNNIVIIICTVDFYI